jgi:hypothetical protein
MWLKQNRNWMKIHQFKIIFIAKIMKSDRPSPVFFPRGYDFTFSQKLTSLKEAFLSQQNA